MYDWISKGRSLWRRHTLLALLALGMASPATAASSLDLISGDSLTLSGDLRLVGANGERSWVDGGFGKLGAGGDDDDWHVEPEIGIADLVWQPRFGWTLTGTVVATLNGGEDVEAGISQAFLAYRPKPIGNVRLSARAGLMWVPISLEHVDADWHVRDTITPSAINSWIGEEVRPLSVESTAEVELGAHRLAATAAVIAANDTAATLLTFRGWALHDRKTLAGRRQPLPPLPESLEYYQAPFTHPLLDVEPGFANRPGYYAKLSWQLPVPVLVELFRYDNRADPEAVNEDVEWGWRTKFNHVGATIRFAPSTELRVQAISGRTCMGMTEPTGIWFNNRFRSAFALLTQRAGAFTLAGRIEAFDTRHDGSIYDDEYDEDGWAATLAGQRGFGKYLTGIVELLHVSSRSDQREDHGLAPRQRQTQFQAALRLRW